MKCINISMSLLNIVWKGREDAFFYINVIKGSFGFLYLFI